MKIENIKRSRYMQYIAAISASFAIGANTVYTTWLSPALPKLQTIDSPLGYPIGNNEASWITAVGLLGSVITCPFSGVIIKRFGPKKSSLYGSVLLALPWIPIIFAKSIWMLYIPRFLAGCSTGIVTTAVTIYNSEIAEEDIRGKLSNTFTIIKLVAHFVVLAAGPFVSYAVLSLICALFPLICICSFYFMPESPYHLIKLGDKVAAKHNLFRLSSESEDRGSVEARLLNIENTVQNDMLNKTTMWELLRNRLYRKALFIMIGMKILHIMNGGQAIESYMQTIIASSESVISPEVSSIIFGVIQFPAAFLASYLLDNLGRKPLLYISTIGCAVALVAEGIYFYIEDHQHKNISSITWIPTAGIVIFLIMAPLGVSSLPYVLMGELFPLNIKEAAVTLLTFFGVVMAFAVTKFFQPIVEYGGYYTAFWIFGGVCICGCIFTWLFLPETKGKSFSQIQHELNKNFNTVHVLPTQIK